ncbi:MAG: hypothetical protein WA906_03400 [Pacificimonas sp.]
MAMVRQVTCAVSLLFVVALGGCAASGRDSRTADAPQDDFFAAISARCGRAFAGTVEVDRDADGRDQRAESAFADGPIVMHVRDCEPDVVRIPLHVGEDRSRTWWSAGRWTVRGGRASA